MISAGFKDKLRIISRSTPSRSLNRFKNQVSFYLSGWTGKPRMWGYPSSVSIEPTTSCNLRCPECPSGLRSFTRPTGMLQDDLYKKVIDQLSSHISYLTFYFQGEPFLNRNFLKMVKYAESKKIYTATSTNAHYLDDMTARQTVESGLSRLIISIDGTTQDVYRQYRVGGKLEKVLEGTRNVIRWKKELKSSTPHVIFQFLVVRPNEHQVEEVRRLAEGLGVDEVRFKSAQVYDFADGNPLIPVNEKYSRYRKNQSGKFEIKNELENSCWRMWNGCVITWDGKVVPCCFDKDASHVFGDLNELPFHEIWNGKRYREFRNNLFNSRKEIDICANCTEGGSVWL